MARDDPSHHLTLADYWALGEAERRQVHPPFDKDFERHLLLNLGLAARMVPVLWDGLATPQPEAVDLDLDQAFAFLNESAWVLEEAGFKVVVPAWWTPQGQRRFKLRLRLSSSSATSTGGAGASGLKLTNLIEFHYQLAIGDQVVSEEEWRRLVQAKTPLVRFRGQWVMLDQDKLQEMLAFWQRHGQAGVQMSLPEILRRTAETTVLRSTEQTCWVRCSSACASAPHWSRWRARRDSRPNCAPISSADWPGSPISSKWG